MFINVNGISNYYLYSDHNLRQAITLGQRRHLCRNLDPQNVGIILVADENNTYHKVHVEYENIGKIIAIGIKPTTTPPQRTKNIESGGLR